jgi:transcriptional regulator with XRE-family HTH domain
MSQLEVASLMGTSETKYWRIENGYDTPTKQEADAIAKILKSTRQQLFPDTFPAEPVAS